MCRDKEEVQETRGFASGRTCRAIGTYWWVGGLVLSAAFCTAVMTPLLHMRVYEPLAAVVLALLVAVLAVRALGQTDLNPVSGVGKLSQVTLGIPVNDTPRKTIENPCSCIKGGDPNLLRGMYLECHQHPMLVTQHLQKD